LDAIRPDLKDHGTSAFVIGPDPGVETLAHPAQWKDQFTFGMRA